MIQTIYRGSVKDLLGPVKTKSSSEAVIFEYTDSFSVFDWGRMPDTLPKKGEALAVMAADFFERIERPETWKEFSKSAEALEIRKANRFGAVFNELGEKLQAEGLRTHYLGVLTEQPAVFDIKTKRLTELNKPVRHIAVKRVTAIRPAVATVLGRSVPDYTVTRNSKPPRLVPLEVVFRFSCPPGSSLIDRVAKDPDYLLSLGVADPVVRAGQRWGFPVLEMFTKLETSDRPVSIGEALAISGLTGDQLQTMLLKTAWLAGLLKATCAQAGLELADGKVEWGISETGDTFLVDAIGPDELRILRNGVQLSKEFLRTFYRPTPWYSALNRAKKQAISLGTSDWKKLVSVAPPALPQNYRELASHLYLSLANALAGRTWFPDAWNLDRVVSGMQGITEES